MLVQAKPEDLKKGKRLFFSAGKGVYHVEADVEVIQEADELNGKPVVVKIIEITQRAAGVTIRNYVAGKEIIPAIEELSVESVD